MRRIVLSTALLLAACPPGGGKGPDAADGLAIQSFEPTGTATTMPIRIVFNEPVVAEPQVGQPYKGSAPLMITPVLPGSYAWAARDQLVFTPSEPFRSSTRYTVVVNKDAFPRRLVGETTYRFNSPLFALENVEPFYEGSGDAVRVKMNLKFSHAVKPPDAQVSVQFLLAGQPIRATLMSTAPSETIAFALDAFPITGNSELEVQVDGGLAAAGGGESIGKRVVRKLPLRGKEQLAINNVYASQSDSQFAIYLRFTAEVDAASAAKHISVEPKVEYEVLDGYYGVTLRGGFQPSTTYSIRIAPGLIASTGATLDAQAERAVTIPDFEPSVRFDSEGRYLMRRGAQAFAVQTVNVDKLKVTVDKVPENNLAHVVPRMNAASQCEGCFDEYRYEEDYYAQNYFERSDLGSLGGTLFAGTVAVDGKKNAPAHTRVPFSEIDVDERRGVYRVRVADADRGWIYAEKWMIATDLGLSVKVGVSEARAMVVSLANHKPVSGVKLSFLSRTNQTIGVATTNDEGVAVQSLSKVGAADPLSLVTAERGKDFSYLALRATEIPTADFDVGGDGDTASPYEAYLYADRGVYRPGDRVRLTAILRDRSLATPPPLPYFVEIHDPKWRVFRKLRPTAQKDGAATWTIDIPSDAVTGTYTVRVVHAADESVLGRESLKVEEFMPDRIKVDVKPKTQAAALGDALGFDVESLYLFGPPAAGLTVDSRCRFVETNIASEEYRSFPIAADPSTGRRWLDSNVDLGEDTLDIAGKAVATCELSPEERPRRPVRATLYATVSERGGRAVTGAGSATVHPYTHYVGVRRNAAEEYSTEKQDAGLEVLVVDRDGKTKPGVKVKATVSLVEWRSILKLVDGRYRYVSERAAKEVTKLEVESGPRPVKLPYAPPNYGRYEVEVETVPEGAKGAASFWVAGSGYAAWEMKNPDQVALTLDKKEYAAGDKASVMVRAPFAGTLFLSVERDKVLWTKTVEMSGNTETVALDITPSMIPNAYVSAQLLRAKRSKEKHAPMRAFGVVPLTVRADRHALAVKLEAPVELRPKTTLELVVKVGGARGSAQLTVAAVDEGILRITSFGSPDPFAFFTRKRRLGVRTHDLFDLLLPEEAGRASSIVRASGGDEARKKHLTPMSVKRVEPVALWSGLVETSADGTARVKLEVPEFNGALRVMAVAFAGDRFGAASAEVKVRDPIVLTPTLPRFVGPVDRFFVPVDVYNGTGKPGRFEVAVATSGKVSIQGSKSQNIELAAGAQGSLQFELAADEVAGAAEVVISASGNGASTKATTKLPLRPASSVVTEGASLVVRADAPTRFRIPAGFLPGTVKVRAQVGAAPVAQFGPSLQYLLQYPHGCVEQTTSRAFPLIHLRDLAKVAAPELVGTTGIESMVQAGIDRVLSMMTRTGAMAYWPGGETGYPWASVYALHFLVEAKKAGYEVDPAALARGLEHLGQLGRGAQLPAYSNQRPAHSDRAYALYVLAVAGKPLVSETSYALKEKGVSEESRALLEGALLLANAARGAVLEREIPVAADEPRRGFWSPTRADALTLSVLADVAPTHRSVPALMKRLADSAKVGRWGTTQENAFALLALGKIGNRLGNGEFYGTIHLGENELKKYNHKSPAALEHSGDDWVGQEIVLTLTGPGTAFASVEVEGIKATPPAPRDEGISVRREHYDEQGAKIDLAAVPQGSLVVTKILVEATHAVENVAIVDLLPAGLEIENPRLSDDAVHPWMNDRTVSDYMDIRDDRLILFTSLGKRSARAFYYTARAVTRGSFVLPNVQAEAMYDPTIVSLSGAGRLEVVERR